MSSSSTPTKRQPMSPPPKTGSTTLKKKKKTESTTSDEHGSFGSEIGWTERLWDMLVEDSSQIAIALTSAGILHALSLVAMYLCGHGSTESFFVLRVILVVAACANAFYLFYVSSKTYLMFDNTTDKEVPIDLVAPSLAPVSGDRLIEVAKPEALDDDDASSLSWLPFIFKTIVSLLSAKPPRASVSIRAWEMRVWKPKPFSLYLFIFFSPVSALSTLSIEQYVVVNAVAIASLYWINKSYQRLIKHNEVMQKDAMRIQMEAMKQYTVVFPYEMMSPKGQLPWYKNNTTYGYAVPTSPK